MNVYAESSAVLAWLPGESSGERVRELLGEASLVIASDLTLLECHRVLIRAVSLGEINEAEAADCRAHLNAASTHWQMLRVSEDIIGRARNAPSLGLRLPRGGVGLEDDVIQRANKPVIVGSHRWQRGIGEADETQTGIRTIHIEAA